jgi:hypothetical protein
MSCRVTYLKLNSAETGKIDKLLSTITGEKQSINLLSFLNEAAVFAQELPRRIRQLFYNFKINESSEIMIVRGYDINQSLIGETPSQHRPVGQVETINRYEVLHILFALLLGEPFTWTTIQNGYIINNVMPVIQHRKLIASSGSDSLFDLHTEDAFHPCAGDYLGLMCLRNPYEAKTVFSCISKSDLSEENLSTLFEPRYIIGANIAQNVPEVKEPSAILFGNHKFPYIRVNLNSTKAVAKDLEAEKALELLKVALRKNCVKVSFQAGDFCYIDNYRVVHGREPFTPNYDGKDRWLKRLYITSSFRNSVAFRTRPGERIINL